MNVKFHKNCENTGKGLKISCVRCNFVKFDIHFPASSVLAYVIVPWKTYSRNQNRVLDVSVFVFYSVRSPVIYQPAKIVVFC